ncbi:MAG: hypothetical protein HN802_02650 [Candidatus Jacksonbacteria bacterium]|jgi:hypothetical protein|nr:hypothetical protein [Candidatus Jacksonbacteria bacterium]
MKLGEYIEKRMQEEKVTWAKMDSDTIDFFYMQWLVDAEGKRNTRNI